MSRSSKLVAACALTGAVAAAAPAAEAQTQVGDAIPGAYIVTFKNTASGDVGDVARRIEDQRGADLRHTFTRTLRGAALRGLSREDRRIVARDPRVAAVEPDRVVSISATQASPPQGLDRIDQQALPLDRSYSYGPDGASVTAYVIDTGIRPTHADFGGRAAVAYDALGGNGVDCNGHGTHVAGTVGGTTYGVAKGVALRGVRVLNCQGSGSSWESAEQVVLAACSFDDVSGALRAAGRALELEAPDSNPAAMTRWKRGALLYLAGRTDEALEVLEAELSSDFDPPPGPLIVLPPAYLALARLQMGDVDGARGMVGRAVDARTRTEFRQEIHSLVAVEALARLRTEEGEPAEALRVAADAIRQCADGAVDTMLVVPRLLGEVARAQLALGDTAAAAVALRQAREMIAGARDPGMLPRRFDALAAAMPAASAAAEAPQTAGEALSQRELEVLTMLPGPLSAAQIATELFVSANTVRTHIKSIHRKLGVSSRSDAVQRARRRGLLAAS